MSKHITIFFCALLILLFSSGCSSNPPKKTCSCVLSNRACRGSPPEFTGEFLEVLESLKASKPKKLMTEKDLLEEIQQITASALGCHVSEITPKLCIYFENDSGIFTIWLADACGSSFTCINMIQTGDLLVYNHPRCPCRPTSGSDRDVCNDLSKLDFMKKSDVTNSAGDRSNYGFDEK